MLFPPLHQPRLTCPTRPAEPADRNGPSTTSLAAPKSGSTASVWLSPQSSVCFPGTLGETRDLGQTKKQDVRRTIKAGITLRKNVHFYIKYHRMLTSGISRGTLRTCMPCKTTGLGWSIDNTCAPSWTSVEVKLEDWDCLSRSLGNGNVPVLVTGPHHGFIIA